MQIKTLDEKVILITGATGGIGHALSLLAAAQGAQCILLGKKPRKLEVIYDAIQQANHTLPFLHALDFMKATLDDIFDIGQKVAQLFGKVDMVIHLAGISGPICPFEHITPEAWQSVMQVNVTMPCLLTQAFLPLLKESPKGHVLFILGEAPLEGKAYWSAYQASQAARLSFARTLHEEVEHNTQLHVNTLSLAPVKTDFYLKNHPGANPEALMRPEEVALHILQLFHTHQRGQFA